MNRHLIPRTPRITLRILGLNIRARMQYRADFLLGIGIGLVWQMPLLVLSLLLVSRFPGLGGWTSGEVLLVAGMRLLSHSLHTAVFANLSSLSDIVQEGCVDSYLLRPIPVYRQVLLYRFNINAIGDLLAALTVFAMAIPLVDLSWTWQKGAYFAAAVVGGTLTEAACQTALCSVALRYPVSVHLWSGWLEYIIAAFSQYPLVILPSLLQRLLTFLVPVAFVAYLPASVLTGNAPGIGVPHALAVASPLVGLLLFVGSRLLWHRGIRYYQGSGL